jgi:hypothetical protein
MPHDYLLCVDLKSFVYKRDAGVVKFPALVIIDVAKQEIIRRIRGFDMPVTKYHSFMENPETMMFWIYSVNEHPRWELDLMLYVSSLEKYQTGIIVMNVIRHKGAEDEPDSTTFSGIFDGILNGMFPPEFDSSMRRIEKCELASEWINIQKVSIDPIDPIEPIKSNATVYDLAILCENLLKNRWVPEANEKNAHGMLRALEKKLNSIRQFIQIRSISARNS